MKERILIIGGRSQAKSLARALVKKKYPVTVINSDYAQCLSLSEIDGLNIIHGDGSRIHILEEADASECDVAIALGEHDADNLVVCQLCKQMFEVRKTIALVNDAKKTNFFYKMGVDSVVCATSAINSLIEQNAITNELATYIPIGEGRVRLSEVLIDRTSPVAGRRLAEISLPGQSIIGCILRGSDSIIPRGNTVIYENDVLLLISSEDDSQQAIKVITGR